MLPFQYKKSHVTVKDKWSVLAWRNGDIQTTRRLSSFFFTFLCLFGELLQIFLSSDFDFFNDWQEEEKKRKKERKKEKKERKNSKWKGKGKEKQRKKYYKKDKGNHSNKIQPILTKN